MKRFVICLFATYFALSAVSAQNVLELNVERAKGSLDSLNNILVETRSKYTKQLLTKH